MTAIVQGRTQENSSWFSEGNVPACTRERDRVDPRGVSTHICPATQKRSQSQNNSNIINYELK